MLSQRQRAPLLLGALTSSAGCLHHLIGSNQKRASCKPTKIRSLGRRGCLGFPGREVSAAASSCLALVACGQPLPKERLFAAFFAPKAVASLSQPLHLLLSSNAGLLDQIWTPTSSRVLYTAFSTAIFVTAVALPLVAPTRLAAVVAVSATVVVLYCEALRRAAGRPAMQALTCLVVATCGLVAAATWHRVGACNAIAGLPALLAGGCCQARCIDTRPVTHFEICIACHNAEARRRLCQPLQHRVCIRPSSLPATALLHFLQGSPKQLPLLFNALQSSPPGCTCHRCQARHGRCAWPRHRFTLCLRIAHWSCWPAA